MLKLKEIKRIVIIVEATLLNVIIEQFDNLGVKGYNCVYCFGKGKHEYGVSDPYSSQSHVRIEILTNEETANLVFNYLNKVKADNYAATVFMDSVFVDKNDTKF